MNNGFFAREISPVTLPDGSKVSTDDGPRAGTTYEKVSQLKPVFRPNGTVTAGNACPLNDGAAAVIVMSDAKAKELGLTPLARIVATGVSGLSPEVMGLGPIEATRKALANAGMTIDDIDLYEINRRSRCRSWARPRVGHGSRQAERVRRRNGARSPFGMTVRASGHLLNLQTGQDVRPGDHVVAAVRAWR
jgi:acetyl-CoA C-acetyltransferase